MVPGYPLKLTPKTPVRPLPVIVMTDPDGACAGLGGVILVDTVVPLKPEKVNVAGVFTTGGVQPFGVAKVTELGSQVQVPPLEVRPFPVMPVSWKEVFRTTFVTTHVLLIAAWPVTPLIVTVFPGARSPVFATAIVIVPPVGFVMPVIVPLTAGSAVTLTAVTPAGRRPGLLPPAGRRPGLLLVIKTPGLSFFGSEATNLATAV
jgi:hypothetical protein